MKESFIQYLWSKQLFTSLDLETEQGESLSVFSSGDWSDYGGADFFNAKLKIDDQLWAGNVEVHIKSSDWYVHHHEIDSNYDNVILHVVWEYDIPVFMSNGKELPTLVVEKYVLPEILDRSEQLFKPKQTINCQGSLFGYTQDIMWLKWKETLFFERLEEKSKTINLLLEKTNNNWLQVLYCYIAKSYGLNTNGDFFFQMAQSLPLQIILKEGDELIAIESILFGMSGLLCDVETEDTYFKEIKRRWDFYKHKHNLVERSKGELQFFKLRPTNFPTIRLAQLSNWLFLNKYNLSELLVLKDKVRLMHLLSSHVSEFWESHYTFTKESKSVKKPLSKSFKELLLLNTIIPLQYAYASKNGYFDEIENLVELARELQPEENAIITLFEKECILVESAFDSQALLQLKNKYCNQNKCLSCIVGQSLLRKK